MKKLLVVVLALCLFIPAAAVMAEDDEEISFYTEEVPEAAAYVSTWVAEDGDWRIEFFDEDGGIKLMVVHRLGERLGIRRRAERGKDRAGFHAPGPALPAGYRDKRLGGELL